jgi:hypothetical protein
MYNTRFRKRLAWLTLAVCGTVYQTTACANPFSELVIREISNVVTDSVFFLLDNVFVRLST